MMENTGAISSIGQTIPKIVIGCKNNGARHLPSGFFGNDVKISIIFNLSCIGFRSQFI